MFQDSLQTQAETMPTPISAAGQGGVYLLVCQGVHVANNLCGHLACVCGTVLEGSLDNRHDERQGRGVDEVDKLGVQQGLQALLRLP